MINKPGNIYRPVYMAREFVSKHIKPGDICIDATCGNGSDTVFLAESVSENGKVYAFDIQKEAVKNTEEALKISGLLSRVKLINDGHENMTAYVKENSVSAVMFNLGWLPGFNHKVRTEKDTTIKAVFAAMELIKPGGIISLCIYSGKDTGYSEKDALLESASNIDKRFIVTRLDYINMPNDPPVNLFIVKK